MTEVEDTRRWSWGVLPQRHESQELRKTLGEPGWRKAVIFLATSEQPLGWRTQS